MLFIYLLYYFRLIFGGADAKSLISLSLLTPFYPGFTTIVGYFFYPVFWPYTIVILTNTVIISLFIPISYFIYNLVTDTKNIKFPVCFLGYRTEVDKIRHKFLWPMEMIDKNGKKRYIVFQKRELNIDEELNKLEEHGIKIVWATNKIPFIVPLCIGYIISFFVGDILNWIVRSIIFLS